MHTDYVDLTLIHWPAPNNDIALYSEYMTALAEAKDLGLTRQIGISNFNIALTKQAIAVVGKDVIATNQIELSPYLQNRKLTAFLQTGITVTSYMTLAYGKVLKDPVIADIAKKHASTPAQVALAWALQLGFAVIPSSTQYKHPLMFLPVDLLHLDADDMNKIAALRHNGSKPIPRTWLQPGTDFRGNITSRIVIPPGFHQIVSKF